MAVNFLAPPQDSIHQTAIKRRFVRHLVGDFSYDHDYRQHRDLVFLPRNMTRVLAFHDRILNRSDLGGRMSGSSRRRGPYLGDDALNGTASRNTNPTNGLLGGVTPAVEDDATMDDQVPDTSKPDVESMSSACLKVKRQADTFDMPQRRSRRAQLLKQYEDKNAQLSFNLVNIRKNLNFKENRPGNDARPRKRIKRESVRCHCHITIWDNREGLDQIAPIIRKTEICSVTTSTTENGNLYAEVELERPFIFKSRELRVPMDSKHGSLGVSSKYFLEIKIIPTGHDPNWPPIPILGPSEGDQLHGLGHLAAEKLQGALIARYLHLPDAPQSDVPLGIFFLRDGRTHRTKYGLEVDSRWDVGEPESFIKKEADVDSLQLWAVDEERQPFGRKTPNKFKRQPIKMESSVPARITFIVDPVNVREAPKGFRNATVLGFCCPACPTQTFPGLEELQFHLLTFHSRNKFQLEKEDRVPGSDELSSAVFKIIPATSLKSRNPDKDKTGDPKEKDWVWNAPQKPFDLPAFVKGDQSWIGGQVKGKPTIVNTSRLDIVPDSLSQLRQQNGFLPAEQVLEFRPANRKKYPIIRLNTLAENQSIMYTSISHRQVNSIEEPRSESDDEMDDEWFVQKTLEELDIRAEKDGWSHEDRVLKRKWNKARLDEKLSHPRYLSDGLIRFARSEKEWLVSDNTNVGIATTKFLERFKERLVIDEEIIRDVWCVTRAPSDTLESKHQDVSARTSRLHTKSTTEWSRKSRRDHANELLALPDFVCGICSHHIEEIETRGLRCAELDCEALGVWYHTKCARCRIRDKLGWKCILCIERLKEKEGTGKSKETTS